MSPTIPRQTAAALLGVLVAFGAAAVRAGAGEPIPVIYDTDIGEDIDDTWALCMLLNSPELDLKLVTINFGHARAKVPTVAKILTEMGRTDVPIAVGRGTGRWKPKYHAWSKDFDMSAYEGEVYRDGVRKIIEAIAADRTGRMKLIAVGPLQNVAAALKAEPRIAPRVELVVMGGSVRKGYGGSDKPVAESNIRCGIGPAQMVFRAPWKKFTLAPTDTAGLIRLKGERYRWVYESDAPAAKVCIGAYKVYAGGRGRHDPRVASSTLYDTLAIQLAWSDEHVKIEELGLRVTDKGITAIDEDARAIHVATEWKDKDAFEDLLVRRITGTTPDEGEPLEVAEATASENAEQADKVVDGDATIRSRWMAKTQEQEQWLEFRLDRPAELRSVEIAFSHGHVWREKFEVRVSDDGGKWATVLEATSSGETRDFETFEVEPVRTRRVRLVLKGHGTWHPTMVSEVRLCGRAERTGASR